MDREARGSRTETEIRALGSRQSLISTRPLDSVDFLNFVIGLHKELGIEIPDADAPKLASLNSCIGYLVSRGA
jgi:acyl carrier protein